MKAVILAAGKGTRMGDLSIDTPKPMLKLAGKPLLLRTLEMLPKEIDEVVITVNYHKEQIIEAIGTSYRNLKVTYIEQEKLLGTAHALWVCKDHLLNEKKFIVMMADNVYAREDLQNCFGTAWSMLVEERDSVKGVSKVVIDENENVFDIIERYPNDEKGYTSPGVYTLTPEIFNYAMVEWGNGEYGLPQTILQAKGDRKIKAIPTSFVLFITTPEDLKIAEKHFTGKVK